MNIDFRVESVNIKEREILAAVRGPKMGLAAATEWHRLYKDYVPMRTGTLYNTVDIRPWEIEHTAPYAHYQYEGEVYGPNVPLGDGTFFSPIVPKRPTGRRLTHVKLYHPKASARWDAAAEPLQKPKLIQALQKFVDRGGLGLT